MEDLAFVSLISVAINFELENLNSNLLESIKNANVQGLTQDQKKSICVSFLTAGIPKYSDEKLLEILEMLNEKELLVSDGLIGFLFDGMLKVQEFLKKTFCNSEKSPILLPNICSSDLPPTESIVADEIQDYSYYL